MSLFCFPSAASSTIRARCTSLTLVSFERTRIVSSPRSSSVNTISVATRTIAPNYLAVVLMTLPNPDKFHQEQNTTLAAFLIPGGVTYAWIRGARRGRFRATLFGAVVAFALDTAV